MSTVAVVAHSGKTMGGGLGELRDVLDAAGRPDALWYEVARSKQVPGCVRDAIGEGAELLLVWGGDGSVRRCIDTVAREKSDVAIGILPAGTANLLALNLGIPRSVPAAVDVALTGERRRMDTGTLNGQHFAVMAGAGLDALLIHDADGALKERLGRAAYLFTGARHLRSRPVRATVKVDGRLMHDGRITCVLVGNVGKVVGGVELFEGSRLDDGLLEVGVVTARTVLQWGRTIVRTVVGVPQASPFVTVSRGSQVTVRLDRAVRYELDGGARDEAKRLTFTSHRASVVMCVPHDQAHELFPNSALASSAAL